jgi:hypothetical protein
MVRHAEFVVRLLAVELTNYECYRQFVEILRTEAGPPGSLYMHS